MSAAIFLSIPQSSVLAKVDSRLTNSVDQPKGQGEQDKTFSGRSRVMKRVRFLAVKIPSSVDI